MRDVSRFQNKVYSYFRSHYRDMPWRYCVDPYKVFVSEVMLQQTQVDRVIPKFFSFIDRFPTVYSLADAPLVDVLSVWQGLGYNRRGLYLKRAARQIVDQYQCTIPANPDAVDALPGVGFATACAIVTYSYNIPTVFIETNIRTVFLHEFFAGMFDVCDDDILPLVEATLDRDCPRDWYYALMDYGAMLKKSFGNAAVRSKHYTKQSSFEGSDRQLRGKILRYLVSRDSANIASLYVFDSNVDRVQRVIAGMQKDHLLLRDGDFVSIARE